MVSVLVCFPPCPAALISRLSSRPVTATQARFGSKSERLNSVGRANRSAHLRHRREQHSTAPFPRNPHTHQISTGRERNTNVRPAERGLVGLSLLAHSVSFAPHHTHHPHSITFLCIASSSFRHPQTSSSTRFSTPTKAHPSIIVDDLFRSASHLQSVESDPATVSLDH